MKRKFLLTLHCPFCHSRLSLGKCFSEKQNTIIHGTVYCQCDIYPIVDGVLYLSKDNIKGVALQFLESNKTKLAELSDIPFFLFRFPFSNKAAIYVVSFFSRLNIFKNLSFSQFMRLFIFLRAYAKDWGLYLLNRFNEKFFYPAAISSTIVKKNTTVLDLGCGAGHLLYLLKKKTSENSICGVDSSLPGIYLSKKYFCPKANYIYLDLEYPLPFKSKSFDYIFLNDVLHLIYNKELLGKGVERVKLTGGAIILNRLHNSHFEKQFSDPVHYPELPTGYASFFPNHNFSLFSENSCEHGFLEYIKKKDVPEQTKKLKTFTLVLSRKKAFRPDIEAELDKLIPQSLK